MKKLLLIIISGFIMIPWIMLANEDWNHWHTDSMDNMDMGSMNMNNTDNTSTKKEEPVVTQQETSKLNTTESTSTKKTTNTKKKSLKPKSVIKEQPKEIPNWTWLAATWTILSWETLNNLSWENQTWDKHDEMSWSMWKMDSDKSHSKGSANSDTAMQDKNNWNSSLYNIISIMFWIVFIGGGGLIWVLAYKWD